MTPFYAIRNSTYHPRTTAPIEFILIHHHICANKYNVPVGFIYLGERHLFTKQNRNKYSRSKGVKAEPLKGELILLYPSSYIDVLQLFPLMPGIDGLFQKQI